MKVILAGFPKTGTTTMSFALRELGYSVYDFNEHFWYHAEDWDKILNVGGTVEDFKRMYENVDSASDAPFYAYWYEVHQAFPDAKIILTTRDFDSLYPSFQRQMKEEFSNKPYQIVQTLSPTGRNFFRFIRDLHKSISAIYLSSPWDNICINKLILRRYFRQHNLDVMQNAPKDKLLVYKVSEGWGPLCEFLGVEVPNKPFPHKNAGGNIINEYLENDQLFHRMKSETAISMCCIAALGVLGAYKLYKCNVFAKFTNVIRAITTSFQ